MHAVVEFQRNIICESQQKTQIGDSYACGPVSMVTGTPECAQQSAKLTRMDRRVQTSVTEGETEGSTECWNSWTSPPVMEA